MAQKQDLRTIYELLDKLCRNFSPDRHKDILKTVTTSIAESPQQGFLSNLSFDESIIVTKIKNHLSSKSEVSLSRFLNLHEELSTLTTPKFRSSILTLLLFLSDMERKLPSTTSSRHDSVFSLPVRNRSSSSVEQIYRGISSKVSLTTTQVATCESSQVSPSSRSDHQHQKTT